MPFSTPSPAAISTSNQLVPIPGVTTSHEIVSFTSNYASPDSGTSSCIETVADIPSQPSLFQQMFRAVVPQQETVSDEMDVDNKKRKLTTHASGSSAHDIDPSMLPLPNENIDTVDFDK
jgi:hypothetical protein